MEGRTDRLHRALFNFKGMNKGAKMIAGAMSGKDYATVLVAGKAYTIMPPTIRKIAGAASHLSCMGDEKTFGDVIRSMSDLNEAAKALSWFIEGNESLWERLSDGTLEEVASALEKCLSLVSVEGFTKLSASAKSVAWLTAKPK